MDDSTKSRLERERHRLVLAESDMTQVEAAVGQLLGPRMNADAERVMWTGLVITYARPFVQSNKVGPVAGRLATPDDEELRRLHQNMCARRNDLSAHNEGNELRSEVDIYAELGIGTGHFAEQWVEMSSAALPNIARLARSQRGRFRARLDEIEDELGRSRKEP